MARAKALQIAFAAELRDRKPGNIAHAFLYWYVQSQFGSALQDEMPRGVEVDYTDGPGEGDFDAVVLDHNMREVIVVQTKLHERPLEGRAPTRQKKKELDDFHRAAKTFLDSDRKSLSSYLKEDVTNVELHPLYRRIWNRIHKSGYKPAWHFVSLHSAPRGARELRAKGIRHFWHDDVMGLFAETLIDWRPPHRPLELTVQGVPLEHDISFGRGRAKASVATVPVRDFLTYMQKDPAHRLFSGNVRDFLGEEALNGEIRDTFQNNPGEFWWSNNGITIICEKAPYEGSTLSVYRPCVINGCQTLRSCDRASRKPGSASVLVRLIRVGPYSNDKMVDIQKTIERTNHQNRISPVDLRANDHTQVEIQRGLFRFGVFYERRKGSARALARELAVHKSFRLAPVRLAQALKACGGGPGSPAEAKQQGESLFVDKNYSSIFHGKTDIRELAFTVGVIRCVDDVLRGRTDPKNHPRFVTTRLSALALKRALIKIPHAKKDFAKKMVESREFRNEAWELFDRTYRDARLAWRKKRRVADIGANEFFKNRDHVSELVERLDGSYDALARRIAKKMAAKL